MEPKKIQNRIYGNQTHIQRIRACKRDSLGDDGLEARVDRNATLLVFLNPKLLQAKVGGVGSSSHTDQEGVTFKLLFLLTCEVSRRLHKGS